MEMNANKQFSSKKNKKPLLKKKTKTVHRMENSIPSNCCGQKNCKKRQ